MELNNYLNTFIDVIYENCLLMNSAIFAALYNVFYCVEDILHTINHLVDVIKYSLFSFFDDCSTTDDETQQYKSGYQYHYSTMTSIIL